MIFLSIFVRIRIWVIGQARGSWSAHGLIWILFYGLWLSYFAIVFVYLMQSWSYML